MRYQTELMRKILKSERAQKLIDYVSPIYGNSYVGLWIFEVMGTALDELHQIAVDMRNETNPATTERLIGMWEDSYGIPRNSSLTLEQRRARLIAWRDRGPCNPHRLAAAVSSALNGVEVDIQENIAKNTFLVNIRDVVYDWTPAEMVLDRKKPAHLIYKIMVAIETVAEPDVKIAVGLTHSEQFVVHVAEVVLPLTNQEIDQIQEEVFASEGLPEGEINFITAELLPLSEAEINEVHDEVFIEN